MPSVSTFTSLQQRDDLQALKKHLLTENIRVIVVHKKILREESCIDVARYSEFLFQNEKAVYEDQDQAVFKTTEL